MKDIVVKLIAKEVGLKMGDVENLVEIPPKEDMGDFAFPCFGLAKKFKSNPMKIAEDLAKKFRKELPKGISNVDFNGAYVNFFIDKKILAKGVLAGAGVIEKKARGEKIMVEFSQANTHKAFHVGHIRGTSVGESLARMAEAFGNSVIRANYQGDTGMHVAKWIWCYNKYHKKESLKKDESWIAGIYVDAIKRLTKNEKLQEEVNEINWKLDSGEDEALNKLWKETRKLSLDALEIIYKDLNTGFDKYYFESEVEQEGKKAAKDLVKKGIAKVDEGATIIDLSRRDDSSKDYSAEHSGEPNDKDKNLGVWVLLRSDGTALYSAKDIVLAQKKFEDYKLDKGIYVVADAQNLHMLQLFKTLELMGFKNVDKLKHRAYGLIRLPTGKMSSRTGDNVLYSDFKKEIVEYARKGLSERVSGLSKNELDARSLVIAVAAIKYSMLKQDMGKTIVFDKKEALRFEGDTGPYLLYSYARASSIVRKVKSKKAVKILDLKDSEVRLLKKINSFEEIVAKAYENLAPNLIANYAFELSQMFNEFYHSCPVLGSEEEGFRLKLVDAFRITLKKSLDLLGIDVLESM
ncbi:MAG: arginine--tRNA ligase [Nanoarchaeota archaeon]|nr:arginine--tRNA ligase [Nanoarchaeota archaeon]